MLLQTSWLNPPHVSLLHATGWWRRLTWFPRVKVTGEDEGEILLSSACVLLDDSLQLWVASLCGVT